jgi:hypothetical protein
MDIVLQNGVLIGQTAFKIYHKLSQSNHNIIIDVNDAIHVHIEDFDNIQEIYGQKFHIKKVSNCKVKLTPKHTETENVYYVYKLAPTAKQSLILQLNGNRIKVYIEDILSVQINGLLEPLINLRKCQSRNEALMNWSLNNKFRDVNQEYLNHKKLIESNVILVDPSTLKKTINMFLGQENVINFVPKKFIKKIKCIQKSKKNFSVLSIEFLDIITLINKFFKNMVENYYKKENVSQINSFNLDFSIELYGNKEEVLHPTNRKSLYLVRKNNDWLHLKSLAILFNLRWFFNTRYNAKKALGFDGEYGKTDSGYGKTLHKYNDVLLWLITHPNTLEDVELVVLDPIPSNYIFQK